MKRSRSSLSSDEEEEEDDDANMMMKKKQEVIVQKSHKCNICGKCFSNGKALGGHRRSHFLKKKPNLQKSPELKTPSKTIRVRFFNDDEDIDCKKNQITRCYICNKKFPTKNALYGHMRSHPDRVCKGVSRPSNYDIQNSSSSNNSDKREDRDDDDDDDGGDGNFSLPKWKKRDKRGRKCIGSAEAATNLLYLRSDTHNCEVSGLNSKNSEFPLPIKKRDFFIGESSSNGNGKKEFVVNKIKVVFGGSLKIENKSDWNGDDDDDHDHDEKKLKTSEGLCESRVDEKPSNLSEEQKKFNFDLNEPYVMED
ncbi:tapetum-specific zinc finger protein [Trifolium pratense]|uniref:Tapetum-specific zinc finger protein n=1 Tax=Trifolium pratense TaxID=57577 RepID=A0A2K3LN69_TRIPR|nr:tapetum-specific zinc finger protein [Trifolium pratense]